MQLFSFIWRGAFEGHFVTLCDFIVSIPRQNPYPEKSCSDQGPVSRKSLKRFGPEKPSVKLPTACFGDLIF